MTEEKVEFPLKPWQKAVINVLLVALITTVSMIAAGNLSNPELWRGPVISGLLTFLVQLQVLVKKDLDDDDKKGKPPFTPLVLFG